MATETTIIEKNDLINQTSTITANNNNDENIIKSPTSSKSLFLSISLSLND